MQIKILGTGCSSCKALFETTKKAVEELGLSAELTKEEENKVKTLLQAEMIESSLGRYDVRLVGFRRKPGNVESSAV